MFIREEVDRLLESGVIELSQSPWRAQVVVVNNRKKKRLVIDYSQTVNRFTYLDAFPFPVMDELAEKMSQYRFFSTFDLKDAYHQVPLKIADRDYTAFEADGRLFRFTRLPFGVTNGVSVFQRIMDDLIREHALKGVFAYLDDVTICGDSVEDHDLNKLKFLEAAEDWGLSINFEKSLPLSQSIRTLGYLIEFGKLRPDPDRLQGLRDLKVPETPKELERLKGLFAYYAKWVSNFSDKISRLQKAEFPLSKDCREVISSLKRK